MRSEQEMLEIIVGTATADDRIRAVVLNGSRAILTPARDPFQDFDVVYIVTDVADFRHNLDWIRRFGELMILQMPDERRARHLRTAVLSTLCNSPTVTGSI